MAPIDYDALAADYAANRALCPSVLMPLLAVCQQPAVQAILEVGCGTANYLGTLANAVPLKGWGIDPSGEMLTVAGARYPDLDLCQGRAEGLPFAPGTFDLIFTVDVIHHVVRPDLYLEEAYRLLAAGGTICTATDSEEIIATRQPLAAYWPDTVPAELKRYHPIERLRGWMVNAGFVDIREESVEYRYTLSDIKAYRDRSYSALRLIAEDAWRAGLARMECDLTHGPIPCVARYVLLWGTRD